MGNSKTKPGVFIQTEKNYYLAGDVVKGCVYINAQKPFPVSKIMLNVQGVEKIWWKADAGTDVPSTSVSNSGSLNTVVRPSNLEARLPGDRYGESKIIEAKFMLTQFSSSTLHGQFAFPFQFQLPHFVPGSFRDETSQFKASVVYELECVCVSNDKKYEDVSVVQQLIVREPRKGKEHNLFAETYMYPSSCCCLSKGVSRICCYFEKNQYIPGEECVAICEADNFKCRLKIREIKIKFKKVVTLVSGFGQEKQFIKEINQASFPGVAAHGQYTGPEAKKINVPLKYRDSKVPIHPSTNGRLVKCHYFLEVTPVMSGWCIKNTNSFQVALNIAHEGLHAVEVQQPENWNPEIYRKSQIVLNHNLVNNNLSKMANQNYI